jgi:hypothetical protein
MKIKELLSNKHFLFPALALLVVLVGGIIWFFGQIYPVLTVNGQAVAVGEFSRNYRAAKTFYENAKKTYAAKNTPITDLSEKDIKIQVLSSLVEARLIDQEARKEVGGDLDGLIDEKISKYKNSADLAEISRTVYGWSINDYTREVLVPQAEHDILQGRLFLNGSEKSFDEWLKNVKKEAKVEVFSKDFRWDGENVVAK